MGCVSQLNYLQCLPYKTLERCHLFRFSAARIIATNVWLTHTTRVLLSSIDSLVVVVDPLLLSCRGRLVHFSPNTKRPRTDVVAVFFNHLAA